jgi:signal transduction histidine kinase
MPRLLHIEDDPANRLLVRKLLKPAGFEVVDAVDGLDGVKKAKEGNYDLVLVDIAIPGLDGYEVTLRLRSEEHLKHVPIVAITAEGNRDTSLSVGCDGFLQKPIDARSFVKTVEGYLGGRREDLGDRRSEEYLRAQSQRIVARLEQKVSELSHANERLLELDQARKEFYRNISHELSTPMTPIVGYTKLLIDQELGALSAPQLRAVQSMSECVNRLRLLIDNLLDVTGIETGKLRFAEHPFNVAESVEEAIAATENLRTAQGQRLVIEVERHRDLSASGDRARVRRSIEQLLENASKFCERGVVIGVRLRESSPGELEIIVADQGAGIPDKHATRIFLPFFQIDGSPTRAQGGTGVGLAVARGVARGHGGDLTLLSESVQIGGEVFPGAALRFSLRRRRASEFPRP